VRSLRQFLPPLVFLALLLTGVLLAIPVPLAAQGGTTPKYSYFYQGRLITLTPSRELVAIDERQAAGLAAARKYGLRRDELSERAAFANHGLGLYRVPPPAGKGLPGLNAASVAAAAPVEGSHAVPVFEAGMSLLIPGEGVLVGPGPGIDPETLRRQLEAQRAAYGLREVRRLGPALLEAVVANPADGSVFPVSRALSRVAGVRYAEPNLIVQRVLGPAPLPPLSRSVGALLPAGPLTGAPAGGKGGGGSSLQAAPTWTVVDSTGFETTPAGWGVGLGTGSTNAVPAITNFRSRSGTRSVYMTGGGTAGVPAPGPYPNNVVCALITPNYNLSTYEEAYVEAWFYAKYETPGSSIFDFSFLRGVNNGTGAVVDLSFYFVGHTGDLTADPTTASGWRRALARIPPAIKGTSAAFQFLFVSDSSVGAEGVYLDDIRIVGTTDVDTEPMGNDTYGGRQYEFRNVGQIAGLGTTANDMNIPEAWGLQAISTSLVVAVIDDGVDLTHPDLNLVSGFNGADGSTGGGPMDASSNHGTACAGNVGAIRNNSLGVAGTGAGVKIMPISFGTQFSHMANAIDLARTNGARVLSNSWGWVGAPVQAITDAINAALAANRTVVFAAGNGPDRPPYTYDLAYPGVLGATTDVICVGASSPTDEHKNASSSDGLHSWGSSFVGDGPQVVAPSPWSYTTDRQGASGYNTNATTTGVHADYEFQFGGTSSSTPKVAGICALLLSKNPNLTPAQVKTILRNSAVDIDAAGVDTRTGNGRVDAQAALNATPLPGFSISGLVRRPDSSGVQGVKVGAAGLEATTNGSGGYVITTVPAGTHAVTPVHPGFSFSPTSQNVTVGPNKTGINFTATPVGVPTGLTAAAFNSFRVDLAWNDNSTGEDGFQVYYSQNGGPFWLLATTARNARAYRHSTAQPNSTYQYFVRALYPDSQLGDQSNTATSIVPGQILGLTGRCLNSTRLRIQYQDHATNETAIEIWRKVGAGDFAFLRASPANTLAFNDTVAPEQTYRYKVRARNGTKDFGSFSNEVEGYSLTPPSNLVATVINRNRIDMTWTESSSLEDAVEVHRRLGTGSFKRIAYLPANTTSFSDTTVLPNRTYGYQVRVARGINWSDFSNIETKTTPP
jgi:subtilisin family serine protease